VKNTECVAFLQWALPQMRMRWPGFRKVRRQVCRRIGQRLRELGLPNLTAYRACLQRNPAEWQILDGACRITISRFYRDRGVFGSLEKTVLPGSVVHREKRRTPSSSYGNFSVHGSTPICGYTSRPSIHTRKCSSAPAEDASRRAASRTCLKPGAVVDSS